MENLLLNETQIHSPTYSLLLSLLYCDIHPLVQAYLTSRRIRRASAIACSRYTQRTHTTRGGIGSTAQQGNTYGRSAASSVII